MPCGAPLVISLQKEKLSASGPAHASSTAAKHGSKSGVREPLLGNTMCPTHAMQMSPSACTPIRWAKSAPSIASGSCGCGTHNMERQRTRPLSQLRTSADGRVAHAPIDAHDDLSRRVSNILLLSEHDSCEHDSKPAHRAIPAVHFAQSFLLEADFCPLDPLVVGVDGSGMARLMCDVDMTKVNASLG